MDYTDPRIDVACRAAEPEFDQIPDEQKAIRRYKMKLALQAVVADIVVLKTGDNHV